MIIKETKTKILDSKPLTCFFIQTGFGTAFTYLTNGKHKPSIKLGGHGALWEDDRLMAGIKEWAL